MDLFDALAEITEAKLRADPHEANLPAPGASDRSEVDWIAAPQRKARHKAKFDKLVEEHPEILEELAKTARNFLKATGLSTVGFQLVYETARYNRAVETGQAPWKLDNSLAAYFSRKAMELYPDLDGVFETRSSYADQEAC